MLLLIILFNIIFWWVSIAILDGYCTFALLFSLFSLFSIIDTVEEK